METKTVRTRFAPSPTGYMHIGNLRTALYAYLYAKSQHGTLILRIEDTDRARYVEDAVDFIKRTLAAAHIVPDEGPDIGGAYGPYVQSERLEIYRQYAEELVGKGHAYRCFCDAGEREKEGGFGGYPRTCRDLPEEEIERNLAAGKPYVIRQKMPLTGETSFYDVLHGTVTIQNAELEDQVLLKSDGMPTYNFANVIDDHLMEVTHIIRGTEFITSTPKHVLLYQAFGWELPVFIHLAPVMGQNEDGSVSKLSKRHGATSFEDLVRMGYLPEAITNYVALLGWNPKGTNQEIFAMQELVDHFSLEGLSKSPAVFDRNKLGWMNGEYLKAMDDDAFAEAARPFAGELDGSLAEKWGYLASLLKPRLARLGEIPDAIRFLRQMPELDLALFANKRSKATPETARELLPKAIALLDSVPPAEWTIGHLDGRLQTLVEATGLKKGAVMWPLRIAISAQQATPGGVTEILYLLGKEESLARMRGSLGKLGEA